MANKQALQVEEQFEIVKALYEEAKLTLPPEERAQLIEIEAVSPDASKTKVEGDITSDTADEQPIIIRSRKPRTSANAEPIFTRISDLYEEANAVKLLAEETALAASAEAAEILSDPEMLVDNEAENEAASLATSDSQPVQEDDFAIPAEFGASDSAIDTDTDETSEILQSDKVLSDEELALLTNGLDADEAFDEKNVTISDDIEPAVALDEVLDGLLPPEVQDDLQAEETQTTPSAEARALSELDAMRPQADDALKEQLADVKQAVEQAGEKTGAASTEAVQADLTDESSDEILDALSGETEDNQQNEMATLTAGPELARFIGETVRDVLDEELPTLVRGLVDETLGERQGRYGRTDTPHIGLRTKPSRH